MCDGDIIYYFWVLVDVGCLFKNRYWKMFVEIMIGMGIVMGYVFDVLLLYILVVNVFSGRCYERCI